MPLTITAITTAALALLLLGLAIETVKHRFRTQAAFGDAEDAGLIAATRSHGNLAEHAPIVLLMLGLLEYSGANTTLVAGIAGIFVASRVAHVVGLHQKSEPGKAPVPRQIGVIGTWLVMLVLAGLLLFGALAG
ncbi:MAG: MAPEG family protein [Pseudomonadota bacterium]